MLIGAVSLTLAIGVNMFRNDPIPWVEKRRLLKPGDHFPYVPLSTAEIPEHRSYLGLPPDKDIVTIADVQTDLLLIEVLNVFCFPCQTHALALSKAYEIIEDRQDLKGKIKIIGVALGNTKEAVDTFMSDYGLAFPVVSDPELLAEKIIGPGIHTPFSLFIRRDTSGKLGLVVGTHDAAIEDPNILLNGLVKLLRMEPGSINFEELF
jgi:peroxiredoxin